MKTRESSARQKVLGAATAQDRTWMHVCMLSYATSEAGGRVGDRAARGMTRNVVPSCQRRPILRRRHGKTQRNLVEADLVLMTLVPDEGKNDGIPELGLGQV